MVLQFLWKKDFLFHGGLIFRKLRILTCVFDWLYSLSVLLFPLSITFTVFDSISSSIDEVLSIKPSANVFVFGDFNVHYKDWQTYSGETERPVEFL